ncbi:MAG: hypothetical protein A2339_04020 [Elusimicrobia bacterium RIFOXYB12_FULL_50_12]|nr:MAG: hypothetical protein A2386_07060 [Elusimicrobia bacterium RIFOXYB1_FULL_48_9]OGS26752.1 MAG: hypothetical protein A2339_04020 [Elusimicrobia bacterium RIFOXYB12_FULL_50_12]
MKAGPVIPEWFSRKSIKAVIPEMFCLESKQWHFANDSKKWIPDYCLWDDNSKRPVIPDSLSAGMTTQKRHTPSFQNGSVWNPQQ